MGSNTDFIRSEMGSKNYKLSFKEYITERVDRMLDNFGSLFGNHPIEDLKTSPNDRSTSDPSSMIDSIAEKTANARLTLQPMLSKDPYRYGEKLLGKCYPKVRKKDIDSLDMLSLDASVESSVEVFGMNEKSENGKKDFRGCLENSISRMDVISSVLLVTVKNILYPITEDVLRQVFLQYGFMEKLVIIQQFSSVQALVHYKTNQCAVAAKAALQGRCIYDGCCELDIQLSILENSVRRIDEPSRNLLVTVDNMLYPITVDVLRQVFSPYGSVEEIVIVQKSVGYHVLVQYQAQQCAATARTALNGRNIYDGCCKLDIQFSNLGVNSDFEVHEERINSCNQHAINITQVVVREEADTKALSVEMKISGEVKEIVEVKPPERKEAALMKDQNEKQIVQSLHTQPSGKVEATRNGFEVWEPGRSLTDHYIISANEVKGIQPEIVIHEKQLIPVEFSLVQTKCLEELRRYNQRYLRQVDDQISLERKAISCLETQQEAKKESEASSNKKSWEVAVQQKVAEFGIFFPNDELLISQSLMIQSQQKKGKYHKTWEFKYKEQSQVDELVKGKGVVGQELLGQNRFNKAARVFEHEELFRVSAEVTRAFDPGGKWCVKAQLVLSDIDNQVVTRSEDYVPCGDLYVGYEWDTGQVKISKGKDQKRTFKMIGPGVTLLVQIAPLVEQYIPLNLTFGDIEVIMVVHSGQGNLLK